MTDAADGVMRRSVTQSDALRAGFGGGHQMRQCNEDARSSRQMRGSQERLADVPRGDDYRESLSIACAVTEHAALRRIDSVAASARQERWLLACACAWLEMVAHTGRARDRVARAGRMLDEVVGPVNERGGRWLTGWLDGPALDVFLAHLRLELPGALERASVRTLQRRAAASASACLRWRGDDDDDDWAA